MTMADILVLLAAGAGLGFGLGILLIPRPASRWRHTLDGSDMD